MKTILRNLPTIEPKVRKGMFAILILVISFLFVFSSCIRDPYWEGQDGRPGASFLALSWSHAEPDYIDAGTGDIPPVFEWNRFYNVRPGYYSLYYESSVWTGWRWEVYAWDVDYDIYINLGEAGGYHYNGRPGADTYTSIECNPYGPYTSYEKSFEANETVDFKVLEQADDKIVILKEYESHNIKITYKRVEKK